MSGGRWKLWHLAALVAVSAALLVVQRMLPATIPAVVLVGTLFLPAILMRIAWGGLIRRLLRRVRLPRKSSRALLLKGALLALFVWLFLRWMKFVYAHFLWMKTAFDWLNIPLPE